MLGLSPIIKYPWYENGTQLFPFRTMSMLLSMVSLLGISHISRYSKLYFLYISLYLIYLTYFFSGYCLKVVTCLRKKIFLNVFRSLVSIRKILNLILATFPFKKKNVGYILMWFNIMILGFLLSNSFIILKKNV